MSGGYISREAALNASKIVYIEYLETDDDQYIEGECDIIPVVFKKDIEKIPAADVVEVVRCKNCENADSNGMGCCYVWCNEMQQAVSEDGWCYRGVDMRGDDDGTDN